jgi:hypothetical protein
MKNKRHLFLVAIGITLIGGSCYYDVEEELYQDFNCDTPVALSYTAQAKSVIDANCATSGCHITGGTGVGNFETYAGVKAKIDDGSFAERTFQAKNMPPNGLATCDFLLLQAWVDQGAPEN